MNNYSSSSSATITSFESQKHDCWVIVRKDQLEYRYEMSCTTALNSKCLNLSWLRLPLICRWRSCVPLTAKNSVFWEHLNFFFLEITKKTYFQLFMDMVFPHTGWEGGVWPALANVKLQMAKIGSKLFFPRNLMWSSFCLLFNLLRQRRSTDGDSKGSSPEKENTWLDST